MQSPTGPKVYPNNAPPPKVICWQDAGSNPRPLWSVSTSVIMAVSSAFNDPHLCGVRFADKRFHSLPKRHRGMCEVQSARHLSTFSGRLTNSKGRPAACKSTAFLSVRLCPFKNVPTLTLFLLFFSAITTLGSISSRTSTLRISLA